VIYLRSPRSSVSQSLWLSPPAYLSQGASLIVSERTVLLPGVPRDRHSACTQRAIRCGGRGWWAARGERACLPASE